MKQLNPLFVNSRQDLGCMILKEIPVIDLHEDVSTYFLTFGGGAQLAGLERDLPGREADIPKYARGRVKIVFASIFPGVSTFEPRTSENLERIYGKWLPAITFSSPQVMVWEHFRVYYRMADEYKIKFILTAEDAEHAIKGDNVAFLLHLEGAEALDHPYDLVLLYKLGLRSIGLTWNYNNKYGSGCTSKKDYGLTPEGEELIRTANKLGVIIDISHASKRTALEAMEVSRKPVMISHANIRRFVNSPRNVDDEVLEALHKNRGVIGISAIGPLIRADRRPTLDDLVDHFMYVYERFGAEILAIGTDFLGLLGIPAPEGFESIDMVQALLSRLVERGISEVDVEKIAYLNALRLITENLSS